MNWPITNSEELCKVDSETLVYVNSEEEWDTLFNFIDENLSEWRWCTGDSVRENNSTIQYSPKENGIYYLHPVYGMHTAGYPDWMEFNKISVNEFMQLHSCEEQDLVYLKTGDLVTMKKHPYKFVVLVRNPFKNSKIFTGTVIIDNITPKTSKNQLGTYFQDLYKDDYELIDDLEITLKIKTIL